MGASFQALRRAAAEWLFKPEGDLARKTDRRTQNGFKGVLQCYRVLQSVTVLDSLSIRVLGC